MWSDSSLAEHIVTVVALLIVGWGVAATLMWHSWRDMGNKIEKVGNALQDIAVRLGERVDWTTFNHHQHDAKGRMVHGDDE